jgi:hypothetical protein
LAQEISSDDTEPVDDSHSDHAVETDDDEKGSSMENWLATLVT